MNYLGIEEDVCDRCTAPLTNENRNAVGGVALCDTCIDDEQFGV